MVSQMSGTISEQTRQHQADMDKLRDEFRQASRTTDLHMQRMNAETREQVNGV